MGQRFFEVVDRIEKIDRVRGPVITDFESAAQEGWLQCKLKHRGIDRF